MAKRPNRSGDDPDRIGDGAAPIEDGLARGTVGDDSGRSAHDAGRPAIDAGRAGGDDARSEDGRVVLLVEDNPGDVRMVRDALARGPRSTTLHHAADGDEALDFVHRREPFDEAPSPDVVLLDLSLPNGSGMDVLEELTSRPETRHVPVIVLSASAIGCRVRRAYELGANAFLTKPADPDAFAEVVRAFEEFWLSVARLPGDGEPGEGVARSR